MIDKNPIMISPYSIFEVNNQLILKTEYKNIHILHNLPLKVNKTLFMQNKG
jgi:hypothetical protein